jgi:PAS domain S-box-containing protein
METDDTMLQAIFDQAAVGIAQIGLDGSWLRVNDRYCQMLGYSQCELGTKRICDITHPDDVDEVLAARRHLLEGAISSHTMEKRYIRKDGTVFWGRLNRSLVRDHDNLPKFFIAVVEDITEKIQAEHALRDRERQLVLAQTAARLGLWNRDLRTGVTATSGEFARLHGLTPDELPLEQEGWLQLVHPGDRERVMAEYQESVERAHVWDTEFRVVWPDGSIHWLLAKGHVFRDDAGRPVHLAGVNLDITERKRVETALRESEERLRFAQQAARIGTFDWNMENGVNTWTPELEAMHGLPPGGFLGTQAAWEDLVHPDDRARAVQLVTKSFEAGTPTRGEWRVVWPDGSVHWLSGRWQVFKNSVGKPMRMTGVNIDVTDRQHVKQALLQSEERFRLAIKATNDAIWDLDLETGTVTWNETYSTLYGRPTETSDSWLWWIARIHAEDHERTVGGLHAAISSGASSWTCEYRFLRADGGWAYIYDRAYIARDASGKPWRVIGAMQDLTDRKQAETGLRESEERFRNMADTAPVMIWVAGPDKGITFFSKRWLDFTGQTMQQALGNSWVECVHPDDVNRCLDTYSSAFSARRNFEVEARLRRADGEYRWVFCSGVPRSVPDDTFAGYIGSCIDITELRRTQEEALARQKLEHLGVLANGIAHDFNNLLGSIMAQAELVEADLAGGTSPDGAIAGIKTVAIHGAEIVRELMIYAGQNQAGIFAPVDLSRLMAEMLELLKVSISKHARLKINLEKNLPAVLGNAPQIRQVLMNLIINASEALGETEGVIQVTTSCVNGSSVSVPNNAANMPAGDYVRLEVSDNGCGMTEEAKTKIFDPFFTTKFAGRGLGLAVVQGIVRAHGGAIEVESAPGRGTTFHVLLPCTQKRALEAQNAVVSSEVERSHALTRTGATVLVVEDEAVLRRAVSKALRIKGFSVMEAADGSVAIDLMRNHRDDINVILLDVTLPGASSKEVFEEATRIWAKPKVVLTSAYDRKTVDALFPGLRITQFIRKPFQLDDLASTLRNALASPSRSTPGQLSRRAVGGTSSAK